MERLKSWMYTMDKLATYTKELTYEVKFRRVLLSDMIKQLTVATILHIINHTTGKIQNMYMYIISYPLSNNNSQKNGEGSSDKEIMLELSVFNNTQMVKSKKKKKKTLNNTIKNPMIPHLGLATIV